MIENFYSNGIFIALFDAVLLEEALSSYQCLQVLQVISRITYVNPSAVMNFLTSYHSNLPLMEQNMQLPVTERKLVSSDMSYDDVVRKFISVWVVCFKDVYDPKQKKVHILGLSSLLRTGLVSVIGEFPAIASIWIEMLEEIKETNDGDCEKYHLNDIVTEQSLEFYPISCEQLRYHQLVKNNDPTHNISLRDFISQTMQFLETQMGYQEYQAFLNSNNPTLLENLQLFLSIQQQ